MNATSLMMSTPASDCSHLHSYQQDALGYVLDTPRCLLALSMGLGKTLVTLTALQRLYRDWESDRILIVAPKRVALSTWPHEIEKWKIPLRYTQLALPKKQREDAVRADTPIHIINVDNLVWLIEYWGKKWPYDTLVIDESSLFKAHNTRRFKALKRRCADLNRVILLTGTPAPNSLMDLWPQVYLLDQGERLFRTITGYRNHYFQKGYDGFSWHIKDGASEEIYERVSDICLRMDAADLVGVPERVDVEVPIVIPPRAMDQYRELEKEFLLQISEDEAITASTAAVLVGKLLQAANGALYTEEEWVELHSAKLDALAEIHECSAGQPLLVAYYYKHDLERLRKRFPHAVVLDQDPQTIDRWNDGEIDMLLAHPQSAGHGLNLQRGGSIIVWFSLTWSLEQYLQFNARLHRQGQERGVVIHHLVAEGTVDETVMETLARKDAGQNALFDALKARAKGVL